MKRTGSHPAGAAVGPSGVAVSAGIAVAVSVGGTGLVAVGVAVSVGVAVLMGVAVGNDVGVSVGVAVKSTSTGAEVLVGIATVIKVGVWVHTDSSVVTWPAITPVGSGSANCAALEPPIPIATAPTTRITT